MRTWRGLSTMVFGAVCVLGAAGSVALTVRQARQATELEVRVISTETSSLTLSVVADIHNTTRTARCTRLVVAARDRQGRDLALAEALGATQLGPDERRQGTVELTLTAREHAEALQGVDAYAAPC